MVWVGEKKLDPDSEHYSLKRLYLQKQINNITRHEHTKKAGQSQNKQDRRGVDGRVTGV